MNRDQRIQEFNSLIGSHQWRKARDFSVTLSAQYPRDFEIWRMCLCLYNTLNDMDALAKVCRAFLEQFDAKQITQAMVNTCLTMIKIFDEKTRVQDVIFIYEKLMTVLPTNAGLHWNASHYYLLAGDYSRGWAEWEWRHKYFQEYGLYPGFGNKNPRWWNGSSLKGKRLLILTDQGYGDIIQFSRYLSAFQGLGATTILDLHGHESLYPLLADHADYVCIDTIKQPEHDFVTSLLSSPYLFTTVLETIPKEIPYLKSSPHPEITRIVRRDSTKLTVGLVWTGSPKNLKDKKRSLKLEQLNELFSVKDMGFFSLQYNPNTDLSQFPLTDLSPYLKNYSDTAAAIQDLDIVISVDTSVAHLAGALGKPVWTLLPFVPDWRWMLDREDSPWYPTMRLFRQPKPGDWASVIRRVSEELKALVRDKYKMA